MPKVIMPERAEKIFLCSSQFYWKSLKTPMSQVLHAVFFISYAVSLLVSLNLKHLLEDEMDLPLEMFAFPH